MGKNISYLTHTLFVYLFLIPSILSAVAEDIVIGVPSIYEEHIAPKLLAIDTASVSTEDFDPSISDNATLFADYVIYITDDGVIYEVFNRAYVGLTEGNLRYLAEDTFSFRPDQEKLYVVSAQTIKADGTILPVKKEGIIHQTPQRDAELAIYSGREELLLVYPGVEKGSIVHHIVVRENRTHRIPGEYTDYWTWTGYWQTAQKRVLIDMPQAMASRLQSFTLGSPTPEIQKTKLPDGRVQWLMETDQYPIWPSERMGTPLFHIGPLTYLTTLPNWDAFSKWYSPLLDERSVLPEEILELSHTWVKDAKSPEEVLSILFKKVAREIRYTSIDFGYAGLQPQSVETIWTNKYGDCKDKSNFLRLLLEEHGIEAYFTLINTDHAGRIDKRVPDYRHFDHAIVTAVMPDGSQIFCDPTIRFGWPGMMTPSLTNRPALLVDPQNQSGRWVTTPSTEPDKISYTFDFKLSPAGELSGWMELHTDNRYASSFQSRFDSSDEVSQRNEVNRYVRYFYPQAEVIDYELTAIDEFDTDFTLRAYLVTPLPRTAEGIALDWPEISWLLPNTGDDRAVKRETYLTPDHIDIELKVALSSEHNALTLPRSFQITAEPFTANGEWNLNEDKKTITAHLQHKLAKPAISPHNFPTLFQAVEASEVWIKENATLGRPNEALANSTKPEAPDLKIEMELMPTGDGQLALVDRLYPRGEDNERRKQALNQVCQWFPNDITIRFKSKMRIAWLYWDEGEELKAIELAQSLLNDYGDEVGKHNRGWAEYLIASSHRDLEESEKALNLFRKLANDEDNSGFRRGWSYYQIAEIIRESEPKTAFDNYAKAFSMDSGDELDFLKRITWHAMDSNQGEAYTEFLDSNLVQYPDFNDAMLGCIAEFLNQWIDGGNNTHLLRPLHAALSNVTDHSEKIFSRDDYKQLLTFIDSQSNYLKIKHQLSSYMKTAEFDFWEAEALEDESHTIESIAASIQEAREERLPNKATQLAIIRLLKFEPDARFPEWLWEVALFADWREKAFGVLDDALLNTALELGLELPKTIDAYADILFLRAHYYKRRGDLNKEFATYGMIDELGLPSSWQDSLTRRAGLNREHAGDYDTALELYERAFEHVESDLDMSDQILSGIYILLERNEIQAALSWIERSADLLSDIEEPNHSTQLLHRWHNASNEGHLADIWTLQNEWWPAWEALATHLKITPSRHSIHEVPTMESWSSLGNEFGEAIRSEDKQEMSRILRVIVNSARWDTIAISELQEGLRLLLPHMDAEASSIEDLIIAIHESLPSSTEAWFASSLIQYTLTLDGRRNYKTSTDAIEAYLKLEPEINLATEALERIGGLHSIKINLDSKPWIERLERQLHRPNNQSLIYTVNILSQLYNEVDNIDKEKEVLTNYLKAYPNDTTDLANYFKTRLDKIEKTSANSEQLSLLLKDWFTNEAPAWLRFMPESNIETYSATRLADIILNERTPGEDHFDQVHFLMACALDDRLSYDERETALRTAIGMMHYTVDTDDELKTYLESFYENEGYSLEIRLSTIWSLLTYSVFVHDENLVKELINKDLFNQFAERFIASSEDSIRLASIDNYKEEDLINFIQTILENNDIHQMTQFYLAYSIEQLITHGQYVTAREQIKQIRKSPIANDPDLDWRSQHLELSRQLKTVEKLEVLHTLLGDTFGEKFDQLDASPELPEKMYVNAYAMSDMYDHEVISGYLKYRWKHRNYDRTSLLYWSYYLRIAGDKLVSNADLIPIFEDLFSSMTEAISDDSSAIELLNLCFYSIDLDDPKIRQIFLEICDAIEAKGNYPDAQNLIKAYRLKIQLRTGEELDIETIANNIQHPWNKNFAPEIILEYYLSRGVDEQKLKRYLEKIPAETLLEPELLHLMLIATKQAGLDLEYELLTEDADSIIRKEVAKALSVTKLIHLAALFDKVAAMPTSDYFSEAWINEMRSKLHGPRSRDFELFLATYNKDWKAVDTWSSEIIERLPKFYNYYYYRGLAKYHLDETEEAYKALNTFISYCNESYHIPHAKALIKEIRP